MRNGRVETRRREASLLQDVDRLSGEPARCSDVSAVAVEAFRDNPGYFESVFLSEFTNSSMRACVSGATTVKRTPMPWKNVY